MSSLTATRPKTLSLVAVILLFGSLWGLSEVVLGGGLREAGFPYRSGLLTGIGMGIMVAAMVGSKKPYITPGIGAVAALVTLLVVPVLGLSPACKANSSLALIIEASSLGLMGVFLTGKPGGKVYGRAGIGALAAVIASLAFYQIGIRAAPCAYLLSFNAGSFLVKEGLVWAAFSALFVPLGYVAGEKLSRSGLNLAGSRFVYYGGTLGVLALTWGISALAIAAGF